MSASPSVRTPEEIRARIELLKKMAADPKRKRTFGTLAHTAIDALEWALGQGEGSSGIMFVADEEQR